MIKLAWLKYAPHQTDLGIIFPGCFYLAKAVALSILKCDFFRVKYGT